MSTNHRYYELPTASSLGAPALRWHSLGFLHFRQKIRALVPLDRVYLYDSLIALTHKNSPNVTSVVSYGTLLGTPINLRKKPTEYLRVARGKNPCRPGLTVLYPCVVCWISPTGEFVR